MTSTRQSRRGHQAAAQAAAANVEMVEEEEVKGVEEPACSQSIREAWI